MPAKSLPVMVVKPRPGMGATLNYPDDKLPYVVSSVYSSYSRIKVQAICYDHLDPSGYCNGYPVFDCACPIPTEPSDLAPEQVAYLRKDGYYYLGGHRLLLGLARYKRDYSD